MMGTKKVAISWMRDGQAVRKVWRFDASDIEGYSIQRVERELLGLFPALKASGLRLELAYDDEMVGRVNIESDADIKAALTTFTEEEDIEFKTVYVTECVKPAHAAVEREMSAKEILTPSQKRRKVSFNTVCG